MADSSTTPPNGLPVYSDDLLVGGVHVQAQYIKLIFGVDGVGTIVTDAVGLPTQVVGGIGATAAKQDTIIGKLAQTLTENGDHLTPAAGYAALAVRKDTDGSMTLSPGEYSVLQTDALGRLKTTGGGAVLSSGTDRSGSIANGGTAQMLAAANPTRFGLTIQNTSAGELRLKEDGTTVTMLTGYSLQPGAIAEIETSQMISIIGASTGQTWAATEY